MRKIIIFFALAACCSACLSACDNETNPGLPPLPDPDKGTGPVGELNYIYYNKLYGFEAFRIPAIVMTTEGTLLAFAEAREKRSNGDSGNIDMMVRRSTDKGATWTNAVTVWNDGDNTCGNPVPIVCTQTGRVHLLMTWNDGRDSWGPLVNGTGHNTRRPFYTYSDDDGRTWATPREITAQVKDSSWNWYATGPCHGIQIQKGQYRGRLISPNYQNTKSVGQSHIAYSDDNGVTWKSGGVTATGIGECAVAELPDGSIILHGRQDSGNSRYYTVSEDGGITWGPLVKETAFADPRCQAGMVSSPRGLFLSNAASTERENMTIHWSLDNGRTWPKKRVIFEGLSAYSDLVMIGEDKIAILFEGGNTRYTDGISFQIIDLNDFR